MIFAHLPVGYLIARSWRRCARLVDARKLTSWAMLGAVLPDIDFLWGNLVDHGVVHHHRYCTHWPLFWLCVVLVAEGIRRWRRGDGHVLAAFAAGVASHLLLDWMVSDLWWAMPFSNAPSHLIAIEPRYHPWYLNYLLHWSGGLDIGIAAAGVLAAITDGVQRWGGCARICIAFRQANPTSSSHPPWNPSEFCTPLSRARKTARSSPGSPKERAAASRCSTTTRRV